MGLFSKKQPEPKVVAPEPLPVISDNDLAEATRIMDQWDANLDHSDAMWNTLIVVGRRGGYKGGDATLFEMMDAQKTGSDTKAIHQRPWRWWNEAARAANSRGDHILPGRIFLFIHMFVQQIQPHANLGNELENGLAKPDEQYYKDIAALAVDSLSKLDPACLIHDTATGKVDVAAAIGMAAGVAGISAPTPQAAPAPETTAAPPVADDGSPWNTL